MRRENLLISCDVLWLRLQRQLGNHDPKYQGSAAHLLQKADVCLVSSSKHAHKRALPWMSCQMQSQCKPRLGPGARRPIEGMLCAMHSLRDCQVLLKVVPEKSFQLTLPVYSYKELDIVHYS